MEVQRSLNGAYKKQKVKRTSKLVAAIETRGSILI